MIRCKQKSQLTFDVSRGPKSLLVMRSNVGLLPVSDFWRFQKSSRMFFPHSHSNSRIISSTMVGNIRFGISKSCSSDLLSVVLLMLLLYKDKEQSWVSSLLTLFPRILHCTCTLQTREHKSSSRLIRLVVSVTTISRLLRRFYWFFFTPFLPSAIYRCVRRDSGEEEKFSCGKREEMKSSSVKMFASLVKLLDHAAEGQHLNRFVFLWLVAANIDSVLMSLVGKHFSSSSSHLLRCFGSIGVMCRGARVPVM